VDVLAAGPPVTELVEPTAPRILPPLDDVNRAFWTGGAEGHLLIQHCAACDRWVHPPAVACATCGGQLVPRPVSGRGTVFTFTVNEQRYHPEVLPPYVIAIVVLDEQDDLRLPTNLVGCDPAAVEIGQAVHVVFERQADSEHVVPLFRPT
jgi:uncharacterized OB-fold protein